MAVPEAKSAASLPEPNDMVQPQRAVAGVEEKIIETGGAHNRRAVGRHRAQAAPKSGLCGVAAVGIQIVEHQFERFRRFGFSWI